MSTKIYTKTGDDGTTSLIDGTRLSKDAAPIDLYGSIDELNSNIGLARSFLDKKTNQVGSFLENIQVILFDLSSNLATPPNKRQEFGLRQLSEDKIIELEKEMDRMEKSLPPLKQFILPSGHLSASQVHICRTICRRVERKFIAISKDNTDIPPALSIKYINRLSDYFFMLARYLNKLSNVSETLYKQQ